MTGLHIRALRSFALGIAIAATFVLVSIRPVDVQAKPGSDVVVRALEKITARTTDITIPIGESVLFKHIEITARACDKTPPEEPPEVKAFLEVNEQTPEGEIKPLFSGWMFASSPGLNGLEHAVYDVWVIDCKTSSGEASSGSL